MIVVTVRKENLEPAGSDVKLYMYTIRRQKRRLIRCFHVHVLSVVLQEEYVSVRPPLNIIIYSETTGISHI